MSKKLTDYKEVRFALIPHPGCVCEQCLMIASLGFHFYKEFAPHGGSKLKCKCEFMPGVKGETKVEGYDTVAIKKQWRTAREIRLELDLTEYEMKDVFQTLGISSIENISSEKFIDEFLNAAKNLGEEIKPTAKNIALAMKSDTEKVLELSLNMIHKTDDLYELIQRVEPESGYSDYALHSNGYSFDRYGDGQKSSTPITAEDLADIIKSDPSYDGGDVRLLACCAGKYKNGAASKLAKILGVKVKAPLDNLYVNGYGEMVVASNDSLAELAFKGIIDGDKWVVFE